MNQTAIDNYIARKREAQNLTQEQLAQQRGVSNKTISKEPLNKCSATFGGSCRLISDCRKHTQTQEFQTLRSSYTYRHLTFVESIHSITQNKNLCNSRKW